MNQIQEILNAVKQANKIVITSHKSADGDSVGSSLGLFHFLKALGKNVEIVHPDRAPSFLTWLENASDIHLFDENPTLSTQLIQNADLLFSLDYNAPNRVGLEMENVLQNISAKKVLIDHHLFPDLNYYDFLYSDTSIGSTSEMIVNLIQQSEDFNLLNEKIGTPLYLGMMTDTGSFRFPSVSEKTHEILAQLLKVGVKHALVHENVYDTNTLDRLRLRGYVMSEKIEIFNDKVAIISLSAEEMCRFELQNGDTEGLVNLGLSIEGICIAAFFNEKNNEIKISFRSKGKYEINSLASTYFNGGGHKYAAGGRSTDDLKTCINKFKEVVVKYL